MGRLWEAGRRSRKDVDSDSPAPKALRPNVEATAPDVANIRYLLFLLMVPSSAFDTLLFPLKFSQTRLRNEMIGILV
ncbi:hypothetical protein K435DRAFT_780191 [Dendrothele bispora CBS 962.96]|uniref:Uncharacterized protein n=1 Tax=Dendrothele bispora (strain CBS 962.96) TaxID=1314807 RepID=A0A4S8LSS8_DENBC|nr:hypothetical protein K435DRAFT_780191 [Dendrothele bispora CBS 962.96]